MGLFWRFFFTFCFVLVFWALSVRREASLLFAESPLSGNLEVCLFGWKIGQLNKWTGLQDAILPKPPKKVSDPLYNLKSGLDKEFK